MSETKKPAADSEVTELEEQISGRLKLVSSRLSSPLGSARQQELDDAGFQIIQCESNHGYFTWKPRGKCKSLPSIDSGALFRRFIDLLGAPNRLVPISSVELPQTFRSLRKHTHMNKFPFAQFDMASLYVAAHYRNVNLDDIDFCFGGSTLEMLARCNTRGIPFLVTRVPHTRVILVARHKEYLVNLADPGYQFERLITGKRMADRPKIAFCEHLQVIRGGSYRVLFRAETDALDEGGTPIEIKTSKPSNWGTKVMFQMMSSGSLLLCHGSKKGNTLKKIELIPFRRVAERALRQRDVRSLEQNILRGMDALRDQITQVEEHDGKVFKVEFAKDGALKLIPANKGKKSAILPPPHVVHELLSSNPRT